MVFPSDKIIVPAIGFVLLVLLVFFALNHRKITKSPIRITWTIFISWALILMGATFVLHRGNPFSPAFLRHLLTEAYGSLLDILFFGCLWLSLRRVGRKQDRLQRMKDEIEDFRGWRSAEAMFRIRGNILRFNRQGITTIDLNRCFLQNIDIKNADLSQSSVMGAFLKNASMDGIRLQGADLTNANLQSARLNKANLKAAILWGADLKDAVLKDAVLNGANLKQADLTGAHLGGADLTGCLGLTAEQLSQAGTLKGAKLDTALEKSLKEKYPSLTDTR